MIINYFKLSQLIFYFRIVEDFLAYTKVEVWEIGLCVLSVNRSNLASITRLDLSAK